MATRGLCTTLIKELDQVPEKSTVIFGLASHLESKLNKQCVLSSSTLNSNSFSRLIDPQWERGGPDAEGPAWLGDCSPSRRVGVFSQEGPGGAKDQPKQQNLDGLRSACCKLINTENDFLKAHFLVRKLQCVWLRLSQRLQ